MKQSTVGLSEKKKKVICSIFFIIYFPEIYIYFFYFSLCGRSTSKHNQTVSLALTCKSLMSLGLVRNTNQMLRFCRLILVRYSKKQKQKTNKKNKNKKSGMWTDCNYGPENNLSQEATVAR